MINNSETMLLVKFLTEHHLLDAMIVACAGGVVNYFIHGELVKENKGKLAHFMKHIFISMFTGFVVGLLCVDFNASTTQTLLFAAIAGTSGSEIIVVLQQKVSEWLKNKNL
ncbi:phage holin family protein [Kalamiella sp. sgz302252]|uniref:phage holin family protein n=1 Tax=Pantoea sp. sgz302252 TaxID=3341827 RepID=UPI0036D26BE9